MNSKPKTIETSKADADIIAKNIRKLMQAKNISDSHLANELGVSVMTIRRVTSGETEDPRISTLSLIADYFDINVDSILEKSDMPVNLLHKSKPFFKVLLNIDKKSQTISSTKIFEKTGNIYMYDISNMNTTTMVNDAQFLFDSKKYPGVEVVDLR